MHDEQTFRIAILVISLMFVPIAVYHRLRSQATGEKLDRWQEGVFIMFPLRIVGVAAWVQLVAYLINPSWMEWASLPLPAWLRWAGAGVAFPAGMLLIWTFGTLGKNLTDTVVTRKVHTLVTSGPYRWVRHPFYVSVALAIVGGSLLAANWLFFVSGVVALTLLVFRTPIEEEKLLARFGDDYREYCQRT